MNFEINGENKTCNSTYFALTIKKTGNREVDAKLKKFTKETLAVLKEIRREHKDFLAMSLAGLVQGGNPEDCRVSSELVDSGIKYDFQQNKNETFIRCFIDYLKIGESFSNSGFSMTKEEAIEKGLYIEGKGVNAVEYNEAYQKAEAEYKLNEFFNLVGTKTDIGITLDDDIFKLVEKGGKEFHDKVECIIRRKIIFDYFKKIGIILPPKGILDSEVDFDDFLAVAADSFADMNETDAIVSKMCKFFDGQILLAGKEGDEWKQESNVGKEYLLDEPERLWYINMREIIIKPYKYESDDGAVSIDMSCGEFAATCKMGMTPSKALIKALDGIGRVYQTNCDLVNKHNVDIDELNPEYVPHTVINGEIVPLDTVAVVSGDMELLEIPLTPLGSDVEMLLTEYLS